MKPAHCSLSYQQAIYQKDGRRGGESPSGYGPIEKYALYIDDTGHKTNYSQSMHNSFTEASRVTLTGCDPSVCSVFSYLCCEHNLIARTYSIE